MSDKCHRCKNDSGGKYYCDSCREEHNKRNQKRRIDRKSDGFCTNCGKEKDTDWRMCSKCQDQNSNAARQRNKEKLAEGKCNIYNCENPRLTKSRFCEIHRAESVTRANKRDTKLINSGLCTSCGSESYMDCYQNRKTRTKSCQTCYLKMSSCVHLGTVHRWNELLDLLIKQNFKCPYTGDVLILGVNDSIDHILPQDRHPERKQDINNMQWITRPMNNMKHKLLEHEFLTEIIKVVKNMGGSLYIKATPHIN